MDDVTWLALTLTLTLGGAIWTWFAFRRRGLASGLRGAGLTLLPLAAYLTKTLQMFTRITDAVLDWATSLVFNPLVWSGVVLAAISVALIVASGMLRSRQLGSVPERKAVAARQERGAPALDGDDSMAEIEALLRKRGIS